MIVDFWVVGATEPQPTSTDQVLKDSEIESFKRKIPSLSDGRDAYP
jgi:hypothetical protein